MKADLLSPPVNFAVVQLPERKFPGVVVQGDTLHAQLQQVRELKRLLIAGDVQELEYGIENLLEQFSDALKYFERICEEKEIALPY